jgi:hypothetical protein
MNVRAAIGDEGGHLVNPKANPGVRSTEYRE